MKSWVIAAPSSGSGKTSITLGLARACVRRGLRVQCFKVGPDYLDPTYLEKASGQPCLNLDPWMSGETYVKELFHKVQAQNDVVLVEGVMGLFDGASPHSLEGSTAAVAKLLNLPILLVVPAKGMARSICATVQGHHAFEEGVRIGGVIANFVGSASHGQLLADALHSAKLPPLFGAIPSGALPELPSRHLGLVDATEWKGFHEVLEELASTVERHVSIHHWLGTDLPPTPKTQAPPRSKPPRCGLASPQMPPFALYTPTISKP